MVDLVVSEKTLSCNIKLQTLPSLPNPSIMVYNAEHTNLLVHIQSYTKYINAVRLPWIWYTMMIQVHKIVKDGECCTFVCAQAKCLPGRMINKNIYTSICQLCTHTICCQGRRQVWVCIWIDYISVLFSPSYYCLRDTSPFFYSLPLDWCM